MGQVLDPILTALFGSETRVRTLAVLASAYRPLTAYRVGKVGGVSMPKVYRELDRLQRSGLVSKSSAGWVLSDRDVGALLRKRARISWSEDWLEERDRRTSGSNERLARLARAYHASPPAGWQARDPRQLHRSPGKDAVLRRMGLRTTRHADKD